MKGLAGAISFLTIVPLKSPASPECRKFFPAVGFLLGIGAAGALTAADDLVSPILAASLVIVALVAVTGALHLDGFMDTADAFGGSDREDRLRIMSDSHVGSFAVVGVVVLLLLKWSALVEIAGRDIPAVLIVAPMAARWGLLLSVCLFPYGRAGGLGTAFQRERHKIDIAFGGAVTVAVSVVAAGFAGLLLAIAATASALVLGRWFVSLFGGMTGDGYGAITEVLEVSVLVLGVVLNGVSSELVRSPIGGFR